VQEDRRSLSGFEKLLNFHKLMNKRRSVMEKMVALILIVYAIALLLGETIRAFCLPSGQPQA
jgi:hypothetical protein